MSSGFNRSEYLERRTLRIRLTELVTLRSWNELTLDGYQELDRLVNTNDVARKLYFEIMFDTASLGHYAEPWRVADGFVPKAPAVELDRSIPSVLNSDRLQLPVFTNSQKSLFGLKLNPFFLVGCTALVALCVYGSFVLIAWNLRPDKLPNFAPDSPDFVAMVRDTTDVQWAKDASSKSAESSILLGEPLKIESGTVELELNAGTKLVVEGPADWSVDDHNSVSLRTGKLLAHVPEQAIGFSVETPTATIVDLGTEFGVDVDVTGRTDVQVITGKIAVDYESSARPDGSRQSVRMTAGATRRFSSRAGGGGVTVTPIAPWVDQMAIGKKLSGAHRELPVETKYAAVILADRPLGYWRFSDADGHRAVDASGHGNHGEYLGFVSAKNPGICPGTSDRSIRFLGKEYRGCVQIKDFEFPASCTVELWARSTSPAWNAYGWLLSCSMPNGVQLVPMEANRGWRVLMYNARVDITAALDIHDGPPRIDDRFHQYAFTYDAATDRGVMYCDGAVICEAAKMYPDQPRHEAARVTLYVGRLAPGFPYETWGEGFVDELAIYGEALTPDGMKRHYEAAQSTEPPKATSQENASPLTK